jgi:hypothetical protein
MFYFHSPPAPLFYEMPYHGDGDKKKKDKYREKKHLETSGL